MLEGGSKVLLGLSHRGPLLPEPSVNHSSPFVPAPIAGGKEDTGDAHLRSPSLEEPPPLTLTLTLGVRSNHVSFREPKGRMELQDHPGLLDHLGPGALPVTLGKMAPEERKAQR